MTERDLPSPAGSPGDPSRPPAGSDSGAATVPESIEGVAFADPETEPPPAPPTGRVPTRPPVGPRRRGPLIRMGPWAPVAGALLGALLGLLSALLLAGSADAFQERLALVLLVVGMGLLGASGPMLADEVRLVRRGAREAAVHPAWVEATAGLLTGLTPARLLLLVSGFVLFLAAYVAR